MTEPLEPDPRSWKQVRADQLIVDENYQRAIDGPRHERILFMAEHWDWPRAEAPTVIAVGGGKYRVIEGQGRALALQLRDRTAKLLVVVIPGEYEGRSTEATIGLGIATSRKAHSALQKWRLRLAEPDPYVVRGDQVLQAYGLRVGENAGPYTIAAVAAIYEILTKGGQEPEHGEELLRDTLHVLDGAWPAHKPEDSTARFDALVLKVVSTVIYKNADLDLGRLTRVLADKSVRRWLNDADGRRSRFQQLGSQLVAAYNHSRRGRRAVWEPQVAAPEALSAVVEQAS